jgi:hypothetical protein
MNKLSSTDTYLKIKQSLMHGCSEEIFKEMRCPICGSTLTLKVHPSGTFFVSCSVSYLHIMMHEQCTDPPDWWKKHETKLGWY